MLSDTRTAQPSRRSFRLGEWLVQPGLNRLSRPGCSAQLEPRTMDLLCFLVRNAGRVVPRVEIVEAVWERRFVAEATLSHSVAQLRRALGDDARDPRYVETISKRGYCLIASVEDASDASVVGAEGHRFVGAPDAGPEPPSIAVLPFTDMSPARDQEYLCEGIAEEITNELARLDGVRVAARTSAFAFRGRVEDVREIGRALDVDAVLEGSVRTAGDRLRITLQLINVADGYHVWSERFDRTSEDIFAIQDEIALGVVARLKVGEPTGRAGLPGRHRTASRAAYDLYLRGRYFVHRRRGDEVRRAVECFERAAAIDPSYVLPHVGIAESFVMSGLWGFLPPALACGRAKAAAARAVEIDDTLFEAHAWLGSVLYLHDWRWEEAARQCKRALELPAPGGTVEFGIGVHLLARGEWDKARALGRRLVALEPLSAIVNTQVGALFTGLGDHDAAAAQTEKALELDPDMPVALYSLGFSRTVQGRLDQAIGLLRTALEKGWAASMLALPVALVRAGRREEALELVRALDQISGERYVTPVVRGLAWAALDERERGVELLAEAEAERAPLLSLLLFGPGYLALAPEWVKAWFADLRRRIAPDLAVARTPAGRRTA